MESNMKNQNRARKNIKTKGGGLQAKQPVTFSKSERALRRKMFGSDESKFWRRALASQATLGNPLAQKIVLLYAIARETKNLNAKKRASLRDYRKLSTLIDRGARMWGTSRSRFILQALSNPTGCTNS